MRSKLSTEAAAHVGDPLAGSSADRQRTMHRGPDRSAECLLREHEHMLALMASGGALADCLIALTAAVSRLHPNTRAAVLMADAARTRMDDTYSADLPAAVGEGIRAVHSTPIFGSDGKAIASFSLCFDEPHEPDAWERSLGQFGANTASLAIERERTLEALRAQERQLEEELAGARILQSLSAQLLQKQGIESLYAQLLEGAMALMHADCASMQGVHPERGLGGELQLLASRGFSPEAERTWAWVSADEPTSCGAALRTGKRTIIADIESREDLAGTESLAAYRQTAIRAMQSTPLISRTGETLGMISTHWRTPHQPTDRDLHLLDILARQAADLIERRRVEDSLRKSEERQRFLLELGDRMRAQDSPSSVIAAASQALGEWLAASRIVYAEIDDEAGLARILQGWTATGAEAHPVELKLSDFGGPHLKDLRAGVTVHFDDVGAAPYAHADLAALDAIGIKAGVSVPLIIGGRFVVNLKVHQDRPRVWTDDEIALIEAVAERMWAEVGRARAEAAQAGARRALESADRQKDEFLAMLAHELRNPLAPIRNAGEILSRMHTEDARAQLAVSMIKRQTAHLTRLVDDLLDVSRITQGRIQLRRRPIDLAGVITQAVETVEPQLREKRHRLSVTMSNSYEPLYVDGDFARLVQCVVNLLSNATKYTDSGGEISVRTRSDDGSAVIEVADTGIGIAPELLPKIFDLFVQSDRTLDRAQGGLGIGLAVVKRLIEMHGGQIAARSAGLGHGSAFEMRLQRIARPQPAGSDATQAKAPPQRVLIVDDNTDAANSLALLLSMQGHEVQTVYGGKEAISCIESFHPDVALLDIGLPDMSGYELAQRLRAMRRLNGIRLVALTGYGQTEDYQRSRAAGFDDHIVKPVDLGALERTLAGISPGRGVDTEQQ